MMRLHIPDGITRSIAKQILVTKKNSPHILFGAGILGVVSSTVLACRATLKLEETLDEIKVDVEKVKVAEHLTKDEYYRLMALKYGRGAVRIGRLYGPTVVVGSLSIAALATSHTQMNRRNQALGGALALMSQAFEEYRERVRDEYGEEKERELYHGMTPQEIEIDGKKQLVMTVDKNGRSMFARAINHQTSWAWEMMPEINVMKIKSAEKYMNDRLNQYGFVLLNEAYETLGLERTSEGAIYGWIRGKADEPTVYISFGLEDFPQNDALLRGHVNEAILDFNVHGIIYDLINKL